MLAENGRQQLEHKVDIFLNPGQLYIARRPMLLKTLLGSCVSIIFYHPQSQVGAMSHALLPTVQYKTECSHCVHQCHRKKEQDKFRFVSCSVNHMIEQFSLFGIPKNEIVVKLFGGAKTLGTIETNIGRENINKAHTMIADLGLTITKEHTGGNQGRIIYFYSDTGKVLLKMVS